jgi:hypothetical protein
MAVNVRVDPIEIAFELEARMNGRAYVAFGGMDMYAAVGRDNYDRVANRVYGFLQNARWHRRAPWEHGAQWVADNQNGIPIGKICSTAINPSRGWKEEALRRIRKSSCMIALLARDPRRGSGDPDFAPWVRWEIRKAARFGIPLYVLRRTDANWMTDRQVSNFLDRALEEVPGDGDAVLYEGYYVDERGRETYEGWDARKWAYPGLSCFLDEHYR